MKLDQPAFLLLLLLVPLLVLGAWLASRQRKSAWEKLVAPRLRGKLVAPASPWSRWLSLGCGLLAFCLLVICLAQPIAGERENTSFVKGRNLIIAVDASRSMLVRDIAPNRLDASKTAVYELLERFPNDRIGLLAFAGSASLQAPLTIDHSALRETLEQLDETNVPSGGSNLAEAVNLATKTFKETGQNTHGLIVISDGELHEGELEDASFDAQKAGVFVVTIGMGSREGDFIPDPEENDGRFRDREGRPVLSRLNPDPLRTLASQTGGLYLEGANRDFTEKIDTVISRLDAFEDEGRIQVTPVPRFQWFLIPAMILMIASLLLRFLWAPARPKSVPALPTTSTALVAGFLSLFGFNPEASAWDNPLEGFFGSRAFKDGDYEKAQRHFEKAAENANPEELARIRYGQGMARYQAGEYGLAGDAFAQSLLSESKTLQRDSHSQLANSLFHRGLASSQDAEKGLEKAISQLEDAVRHYDSALELDGKHDPSLKNRKATEEALEQLKKQQEQQQQQEQEQNGEDEEQEQQDGDEQEKSEGEGEEDSENQEGEEEGEEEGEQGGEENQEGESDEGQEGEQQEQEGEGEQNKSDKQQDGKTGEEDSEPQKPQGSSEPQPAQPRPAPREDETAEEFARRILKENADFQQEALRKRGPQVVPTKDW